MAFFLRYYKKKQEKRSQYQIETINENGSIGNSYYAFYIEILEYVNDYCLKRIERVQLPLDLRMEMDQQSN